MGWIHAGSNDKGELSLNQKLESLAFKNNQDLEDIISSSSIEALAEEARRIIAYRKKGEGEEQEKKELEKEWLSLSLAIPVGYHAPNEWVWYLDTPEYREYIEACESGSYPEHKLEGIEDNLIKYSIWDYKKGTPVPE